MNDEFLAAEFNDIVSDYVFSLANLLSPVDPYLTISNQDSGLSPSAGQSFEFKNLKKLDRLSSQDYLFHIGDCIVCFFDMNAS